LRGDRIKLNENSELAHARSRTKPETGEGIDSGLGSVTIDFKPGPDARDRLRRLYSILLQHAATDGTPACGEDRPEREPAIDGAAAE